MEVESALVLVRVAILVLVSFSPGSTHEAFFGLSDAADLAASQKLAVECK